MEKTVQQPYHSTGTGFPCLTTNHEARTYHQANPSTSSSGCTVSAGAHFCSKGRSNSAVSDNLLLALHRSGPNTRLFRALFQYIPLRDSPNDNPHLELSLQAGDYILVHGQMDEDQFYLGETLAGKTGLVPSNYVEQISDTSLLQNAARAPSPCSTGGCCPAPAFRLDGKVSVATQSPPLSSRSLPPTLQPLCSPLPPCTTALYDGPLASPSFALAVPAHFAHITHDFTDSGVETGRKEPHNLLPDSVCPYPPVDVSKVIVQEVKLDKPRVPVPRELNVEKKLSRSAVFCWLPPDDQLASISQYHVCVDGAIKAVVPGSYKCKALIEELSLERSVNVSVRAITENGHSPDAACTIAVGTEAPVAPQHVRVTSITPISAIVCWYPSNSNADHVVLLNAIKVGVCPPAVFQVHLQGLSPSTIYRVSVRTKHPKAVLEKRPVERCVDFKTLPKIGLPDPPANVQVEVGPQPGTLLITWKPVTNQPRPPSRAAIHSYLIFADGKQIAQCPTATADHVLLRLADLADDPPIFITVRTRTREGTISADSNVVRVPRSTSSNLNESSIISSTASLGDTKANYSLLATTPLNQQKIGSIQQQQPIMPNLPMNILQQQQQGGLLTTANMDDPPMMVTGAQYVNSAYPPVALLNPQAFPVARPLNVYTTVGGSSNQPMSSQHYSIVNQYNKIPHRGNATGLHNGTSPRMYEPKQKNQAQYYTFHPKSLYKDFPNNEEKPSVLELENNYLLKHHQQYNRDRSDRENQQQWIGSLLAEEFNTLNTMGRTPRLDYYVQSNGQQPLRNAQMPRPAATVLAGTRRPVPSNPAIPSRLARVRSDEYLLGTRSEPDLRPMAAIPPDEENSRWFVALYDYSHHMSPNPNAQQEELSFRKHQLIKVYGDADPDGFYYAEIGRRFGLVPSNMVIEIAKDEVVPERRRSEAYPADPVIRRMRWGSLKSRSYDHPADRSRPRHPSASSLAFRHGPFQQSSEPSNAHSSSLERRDNSMPASARYPYGAYGGVPTHATGPPAVGSLSARSGRAYGYASTSAGYEHRRLSASERGGYDQLHREHMDSYPLIKPTRGAPQPGDYYPLSRRAGEWREEGRGAKPPDQYDYSVERGGELPQPPPQQQHYPGDNQEYGGGRGRPAVDTEHFTSRYDNYNDVSGPLPAVNNNMAGLRRMANPEGGAPRFNEEVIGPQQQSAPFQQSIGDQQVYGAQQQQAYNSQTQYASQEPQGRYPPGVANSVENNSMATAPTAATWRMIAKYDYDSRQLSPNVDAEQVELSFRQGEVITVFGEMDEDGFYIGELNGIRGLVPSNFLQPALAGIPNSLMTPAKPAALLPPTAPPVFETVPRAKGVAFTDNTSSRKPIPAPMRQISQGSSKSVASAQLPTGFAMGTGGTGMTSKANKVIGSSAGGISAKPLTKKTSDLTSKSISANNNKKGLSAKKGDGTKKK